MTPISSTAARKRLQSAGVTLAAASRMTDSDLLRLPGVGRRTLAWVRSRDRKHKLVIVPTRNLASLVYRAVRAGRTPYNYCAGWYDVSGGIGLSLAQVDWLTPGQTYVTDHRR